MNHNKARDDGLKWYNFVEYVVEDTGEMIPKYKIDNGDYRVIGEEKKVEIDKTKKTAICKRLKIVKVNEQLKMNL